MSHPRDPSTQTSPRRRRVGPASGLVVGMLLALAVGLVAAPAALARFNVQKLRLGTASGAEDYLYTSGNTVVEQATVDSASYYRFDVYDPSGAVRYTSACLPSPANRVATGTYVLHSSDPLSNATAWRFRLREFGSASTCASASSVQRDGSLYFDVAAASSYTSSALTTKQTFFKAAATAYVQVAGTGKVKGSASNTAQGLGSWSTSWILPSGATACANTKNNASDLPGSTAGGQLPDRTSLLSPALPNLQYRPSVTTGVDPWNLESNYETGPCQDLASTNQGQWSLKLARDATHFVTLAAFSVDTTPPDTTLTGGPSKVTDSTTATFQFTSSEGGSSFQCSLDGAPASACSAPKTYSGLANGAHTFSVQAIDPAGNVDPTAATLSWTVDTSAPRVTLTSPGAGSYTNNATPVLAGTAETTSGDSPVTVAIYAGTGATGTPLQTLTASVQGDGTWNVSAARLADGTYTVQAQQTDGANNTGYSAQSTFTVDSTPPTVTVSSPTNGTHTNDPTPYINGTAGTAASDGGAVTVTITGGGAPVQATASVSPQGTWDVTVPQALADGTYTVQATQGDLAGNTGYSFTHTLTIDTTPPQTFLDAAPAGTTSSSTATFSFHSSDALSQNGSTFQCQLDGGAWGPCSSPKSYYNLPDGSHTFSVQAIDGAGNVDTAGQSVTWTINSTLPAIALDNPPTGTYTNDTAPTFSGFAGTAAGDSSSVQVLIYANSNLSGSPLQTLHATAASDGSWSTTAATLQDGTYVAYAQQSGTAGPASSDVHTFTVDTMPPTATITVGPPGSSGSGTASFSFVSSESGSTFQCQLDGGGWTACLSPQHYSGLTNGSHTFEVRAGDRAGNVGAPDSQTWSINTNLPALNLSSPSDGTITNNQAPAIRGTGGIASGDASTVTIRLYSGTTIAGAALQTIVTTVSSSTGAWSTHPNSTLPDGTYTVYAQQDGSAGTAYSSASTFTVDTVPPTTTITSGPQGTTSATSARFAFTSAEAGSTFQCQLDGGAWTTCTSPQSYGSLALGTHTFSVRATDPAGNVESNPPLATWTIDTPTNVPVTLAAPADGTMTNVTTPTFSGAASGTNGPISVEIDDVNGNPVETLTAAAASSWSVNASPALPDGSYTAFAYQLSSDGITTNYSNVVEFTIDTTPPAVTLTSAPTGTTNDSTPTFSGAASTAPGDLSNVVVKVYPGTSASGTPVRTLSATEASGSWSATAATLADGTYTVRAEQSDAAGNTGTSATRTFTIDTTPPAVTLTSGPSGSASNSAPSFGGGVGTASGDLGAVMVNIYSGGTASGTPVQTLPATVSGGSWSATAATLADGTYTVRAEQSDAAGNTGTSATRTFTVDTTPPAVTLTNPANGGYANHSTPMVNGSAEVAAGDSDVTVKIFAGSTATGTPVQTLTATVQADSSWTVNGATLAEGTYTALAQQSDAAGNTGTSSAHTFTVDITPPQTSISDGPAASTAATSATFSFNSSETGSTFQCQLDGGTWTTCTSPQSYTSLAVGTHTFGVRATDAAGNLDPTPATSSWTVTAPPTTTTPPPTTTPRPPAKLQLTLTAKGKQRFSRRAKLTLQARCSQACSLVLTRTLSIAVKARHGVRSKPRTFVLQPVRMAKLPAGKRVTLILKLSGRARAAVATALVRHRRVTLTLSAAANAPGMSPGSTRVTIRLVR